MRVDLHLHTSERSYCAVASAASQLGAARAAGLGAVAVTDHHRLTSPGLRRRWQERFAPLLVLPGIEISLEEDVLVLGLDDVRLEEPDWTWPELHDFVRERGGLLVLAHPFRYQDEIRLDLERFRPDAIEAWSSNLPPVRAERIAAVAGPLGVPVVADSDAHGTAPVGRYWNELLAPAASGDEVLELIRAGRFLPHHPGLTAD